MGSPPRLPDLPEPARTRAALIVAAAVEQMVRRADEFEFVSFKLAARAMPELRGDAAWPELEHWVRSVLRVEARERLVAAWPTRRFDGDYGEMVIEIRPRGDEAGVWFDPQPAYVAGRYCKFTRDLSQTALFCRRCRGRGRRRGVDCAACTASGRAVGESVEDFIRPVIRKALGGVRAAFHGSGREDVDVRMLGRGRPFAVSVESPRWRSIDAAALAADIVERSDGRVVASDLRVVPRAEVRRLTTEHGGKAYRAVVRPVDGLALPPDAAQRVAELDGAVLAQRTPQRVGRRADRVRQRTVRSLVVERAAVDELVVCLETDPGLYVKEFVSGDDGRTQPSVSALLGLPCVCAALDVLDVLDAPEVA